MTKKNKNLLGLLGVAAVGAGVAYLMTTEKGGRIRKNIKEKTQGLVEDLKTKGKAFASDKQEFASSAKKDGSAVPSY